MRYCDSLFTFLDYPAMILRKNSQSNRSEKGAAVQAVLMSVYRTMKLRSHDPLKVTPQVFRAYLASGTLTWAAEKYE